MCGYHIIPAEQQPIPDGFTSTEWIQGDSGSLNWQDRQQLSGNIRGDSDQENKLNQLCRIRIDPGPS
jgi:hypothetical protein